MVKKSFAYVVAAPFMSVFLMYLMKEIKSKTSMTQNFVGGMRRMSEGVMGSNINYARSSDKVHVPDAEISAEQNKLDNQNLNKLYQGIKQQNKEAAEE